MLLGRFGRGAAYARLWSRFGSLFKVVCAVVLAWASLSYGWGPMAAHADTAPTDGAPQTATAQALATVQINGVVWTQQIVGNRVYVGGNFTKARPAGVPEGGAGEVTRNYLLAYDLSTGELIDSFNPGLNAQVKDMTLSPDGSVLYVGGQFTTVGGASRYRLAAFDAQTGALLNFKPNINASVYGIAATEGSLFLVGSFTTVGGQLRDGVAEISASTAAVSDFNAVVAGGDPQAVVVSPDATKVVIGGSFTSVNGSSTPGYGLAMLEAASGALLPLAVNSTVRNGTSNAAITALEATSAGFYGTGFTFGRADGNLEGMFRATWGGELVFLEDCHGDSYGVYPDVADDVVYVAGHAHYCGNVGGFPQPKTWQYYRGLAFGNAVGGTITRENLGYTNFEGLPRPDLLHWFPEIKEGTFTGMSQGPWDVTGNSQYILYGGEFPTVNGLAQQGLVRFAKPTTQPSKMKPTIDGSTYTVGFMSLASGKARVSWPATFDRDNERLQYQVFRGGKKVFEISTASKPWLLPRMSFIDSGLVEGTTYDYSIKVIDPDGNATWNNPTDVTYSAGAALSSYDAMVLGHNPMSYWPLDEAAGATMASDVNEGWNGKKGSLVTPGGAGAIAGSTATAYQFSPTTTSTTSTVAPQSLRMSAQVFTTEAWFKTSSVRGGALVSFGSSVSGASSTVDRVVYMATDGRLLFGVNPGQVRTIASTAKYNNNAWHHVVATLSPAGMALYVDGALVASRADSTVGRNMEGVWRIGGDKLSGWTSNPSSGYLSGSIDQVAVYAQAFTAEQAAAHYYTGVHGQAPNQLPSASLAVSATDLAIDVSSAGSSDPDGTIVSYAWDFGDGATASGASASHKYSDGGTYTVTLAVTDDRGGSGTASQAVTVVAPPPNQTPVAAFTSAVSGLSLDVDASASTDPDGTIASYEWEFGDGATGSGQSANHVYAASGTYTVSLVVTDDDGGASDPITKRVTVEKPANSKPVGAYSVSTTGLTVSVDASATTDADDNIAAYVWDFGDGSTENGVTATHTYSGTGSYLVKLTVSDEAGASDAVAKLVQVGAGSAIIADNFNRSVTRWGSADTGGTWTYTNPSFFSTDGKVGVTRLSTAGATGTASLSGVALLDSNTFFNVSLDTAPTGSGVMTTVSTRKVGTSEYRMTVQIHGDKTVRLNITKRVNGVSTNLGDVKLSNIEYNAGDVLNVRFVVKGTGSVTLEGKVWKQGSAEPATAQIKRTDASPELQAGGDFSIINYATSSVTGLPINVQLDDLLVTPA